MKKLFEPAAIGNLKLKNRLVRSATLENGGAENHVITPVLKDIYEKLADGGVGLIITGMMGVTYNSCVSGSMSRIDDESFSIKFRKVVDAVHRKDGKVVVQLGHCGVKSTIIDQGDAPFAPSDIVMPKNKLAKAMTQNQIHDLAAAYGAAAVKCKDAGADGVEIHAAHGYLISQFLSPYFNKRDDQYGGSIENRSRLLFEIYNEIRKAVGAAYPILIKINYSDLVEESSSEEEIQWVCKELEKSGIDGIEVSSGISVSPASAATRAGDVEGFFADYAIRMASVVNTAVISVGGYRTPAVIENYLNQGDVTAISMCRPLILEPDLPERWRTGDTAKSSCISCNKCFMSMPLTCTQFS